MKPRIPKTKPAEPRRRISLPEIFDPADHDMASPGESSLPERCVLMVAASATIKSFLAPIFRREECRTLVASTRDEMETALAEQPVTHILVAQDMVESFSAWVNEGALGPAGAEVSLLTSVSGALLENPVPYGKMLRSIFSAVRVFADERTKRAGVTAPYALVTRDIRILSRVLGLRRIASDGTELAAWMLTPAPAASAPQVFEDFGASLALARALNFPWRVDTVLERTHALFAGTLAPVVADASSREVDVAAQILALTWYRHAMSARDEDDEEAAGLKGRLRTTTGRLASVETVEAYVRQVESSSRDAGPADERNVVMVTRSDELVRDVATRFGRQGLRVVARRSMEETRMFCEANGTAAVLVDFGTLGMEAARLCLVLRLVPNLLLYGLVESTEPSITLDLIDAGFDDVLVPPLDLDVVAARISRAARGAARRRNVAESGGGFRATFAAFSFVDLVQSLAQSRKSVRIDLNGTDGATAVLYMDAGRLVHARAGTLRGSEAVYRVVAWGDDGSFAVEPVSTFPPANISEPTEAVLMEGCRRFDEAHAAR